jgi:hypothetical protein
MQGTVLYGIGDISGYRECPRPEDHEANRRSHPLGRDVRVRIGPLELSRDQPCRAAHAHGP